MYTWVQVSKSEKISSLDSLLMDDLCVHMDSDGNFSMQMALRYNNLNMQTAA